MQKVLGHNLTAEQRDLLRLTASKDMKLRMKYRRALAQVLEGAWKAAVLEEDSISLIYQTLTVPVGADTKFPLHFLPPGAEEDRVAFVMPKEGAIPHRFIEGDEVYVPTYEIANSIDWPLRYARDARWDVVADAMDVFRYGFTRKMNDDGWHTLLAAAIGNGRIVDGAAAQGAFTKRLVTNLMTGMQRLTGGRASRVTDLFLSPEAMGDIRNWTETEVDEITRREIFTGPNPGGLPSLFGIALHELQELGDGQRYQTWLEDADGGNQAAWFAADDEACIALDLRGRSNYPFKMPLREDLGVFDDENLHRSARMGVYGWMELGFVVLDARYALIGTF
jgi:hypothetical protein